MKVIDRAWVRAMRTGETCCTNRGDSERYDWDDAYYPFSFQLNRKNNYRYSNKEVDALLRKVNDLENGERKPIYGREIIRRGPVQYMQDSGWEHLPTPPADMPLASGRFRRD
jgi:hypothetical protein